MFIFCKYIIITLLLLSHAQGYTAPHQKRIAITHLHRFNDYPQECEKAILKLQQMHEVKAMLARINQEGGVSIALHHDENSQFDAFWDGEKRVILVNPKRNQDVGAAICSILFELHNAKTNKKFLSLVKKARQSQISKDDYVENVEKMEFQNALDTHKLLEKGIAKGVFPSSASWKVYHQFEDYYKAQQLMGHSEWLANSYDALNRKHSQQSYRGTIPNFQKMSQQDKQEMLYYLSIKNSLSSPKTENCILAKSKMQQEFLRLKDFSGSANKREQNFRKLQMMQVVFQGNHDFDELKNSLLFTAKDKEKKGLKG